MCSHVGVASGCALGGRGVWVCSGHFISIPCSSECCFLRKQVPCRLGAKKLMAKGLFSEAEVIRGYDWIWGNQDGKGLLSHCSVSQ